MYPVYIIMKIYFFYSSRTFLVIIRKNIPYDGTGLIKYILLAIKMLRPFKTLIKYLNAV